MRPGLRELLPDVEPGAVIPPVIHQTYPTLDLPDDLRRNVDRMTALNPGWEHRLYDDRAVERFIREQYGEPMLRLFRSIDPSYGAARADLFRYLAVYRLGGVNLDIKSRFRGPIDQFIRRDQDRFVVSQWSNGPGERYEHFGFHADAARVPGGEYQQWHVIAAPGSPFLRAVLERVCANIAGYRYRRDRAGWVPVLRLTGPVAYTLAIAPLLDVHPHRRVRREAELGLDYSIRPGNEHRGLFRRHYSANTLPIVRRAGLPGWLDAAYHQAGALKRRLGARADRAGAQPAGTP
jgi:inositol phosphorylceramide mannosyltransferase catalytic subunit